MQRVNRLNTIEKGAAVQYRPPQKNEVGPYSSAALASETEIFGSLTSPALLTKSEAKKQGSALLFPELAMPETNR